MMQAAKDSIDLGMALVPFDVRHARTILLDDTAV
jgi:hypothetical protein